METPPGNSHQGVGGLSTDDGLDVLGLTAGLDDGSTELESDASDDTEDVPLRRGGGGSAHEVGRSQGVEVRDGVGGLGVVASVDRLGGGHVVGAGAHTAEPGGDLVELCYLPSDAEPLESPELGNLPVGVGNVSLVVQEDLDLPVSLETGDRVHGHAVSGDFLLVIPNDRCCHFTDLLP